MQVVACGASVFNLIVSVSDMVGHRYGYGCWKYVEITSTDHNDSCYSITASTGHYFAELVLINTALIAISVTLAAYCCKVVNCCSPGQQMNYHDLAYDGNAKRKKIGPCSPCLPRTDITLKCKVWLEAYQYYACGVSRMG
uniref:Uncharacterized protein n=1 Tax=Hucho hucho TaxID=62062 RepID=A0A4W5KGK4_9TELE